MGNTKELEKPDSEISPELRAGMKGYNRAVREWINGPDFEETGLYEWLDPLDCQISTVLFRSDKSVEQSEMFEDLHKFYELLAHGAGADKEGNPFIKPEEIKNEKRFRAELEVYGDNRILIINKDKATGGVIDAIYSPLYEVSGKLYATLEYQCSEASYHGLGFGATTFAVYSKKLREIAEERKLEFGGILIEAVATDAGYWEYVGAKSPYLLQDGVAIKIDYAMPCVDFDPETGEPTSDTELVLRENLKLAPGILGKDTITVGELKNIISAFYETSYLPTRDQFNSELAWQKAVANVRATLQTVCLDQFSGVSDDTILSLNYDQELVEKKLEVIKPWERIHYRRETRDLLLEVG